ncbi:MAG: hypothetical protein H6807_06070 [Planctomycetes bacterium]|nr:hypothetical protein [Planctomycetota bacterium]
MEDLFKLLVFLAIIIGSIAKSAADAKKKREERNARRDPAEGHQETTTSAPSPQGKSLAEWIEEVRRHTASESRPVAAPPPAMAEEEVVVHHQRHEALRPSGKVPQESIKSKGETPHEFHEAVRPSVIVEENEAEAPERRPRQVPRGIMTVQKPRVEVIDEAPSMEAEARAPKAQRAQRAQRAGARSGGKALGGFGLGGGDLRRAFIMKELLDAPLALRQEDGRE